MILWGNAKVVLLEDFQQNIKQMRSNGGRDIVAYANASREAYMAVRNLSMELSTGEFDDCKEEYYASIYKGIWDEKTQLIYSTTALYESYEGKSTNDLLNEFEVEIQKFKKYYLANRIKSDSAYNVLQAILGALSKRLDDDEYEEYCEAVDYYLREMDNYEDPYCEEE